MSTASSAMVQQDITHHQVSEMNHVYTLWVSYNRECEMIFPFLSLSRSLTDAFLQREVFTSLHPDRSPHSCLVSYAKFHS